MESTYEQDIIDRFEEAEELELEDTELDRLIASFVSLAADLGIHMPSRLTSHELLLSYLKSDELGPGSEINIPMHYSKNGEPTGFLQFSLPIEVLKKPQMDRLQWLFNAQMRTVSDLIGGNRKVTLKVARKFAARILEVAKQEEDEMMQTLVDDELKEFNL